MSTFQDQLDFEGLLTEISRNGRTGKLLSAQFEENIPANLLHVRCQRATLQNALLAANDRSKIRTSKKLTKLTQLPSGRVQIAFDEGFEEVDLVIGADGIRSVFYFYETQQLL